MPKKKVTSTSGLTDNDVWMLQYVAEFNDEEVKAALDQALARAMEKVGLVAEGDVKVKTPKDTGRLQNSITHQLSVDGGDYSVMVGTNVEYAPFVELGTHDRDGTHFMENALKKRAKVYAGIIESELKSQ